MFLNLFKFPTWKKNFLKTFSSQLEIGGEHLFLRRKARALPHIYVDQTNNI